ncbi:hypothetical protein [Thermoflavimicrobium dichotomicum]|uniref:DUF1294 domain-containing protein n=1 Tax=Thermoflavimicrobium dichotomicum TaxID=46223 RepID=A0A1I3TGW3_9BACL|nr:hypothetical protein [Thermoflavimicrobium dichotomicum]SFJ68747.1 hypothetical protein SAMN05421852_11711 [Thermoflavimicrobium dichotomicum]
MHKFSWRRYEEEMEKEEQEFEELVYDIVIARLIGSIFFFGVGLIIMSNIMGFRFVKRDKLREKIAGWFWLIIMVTGGAPGILFGMIIYRHLVRSKIFRICFAVFLFLLAIEMITNSDL